MFEASVFQKIIDAWSKDQEHPHRKRLKKALPREEDVRFILETAFKASIKREEGQTIRFSVTLLSKEDTLKAKRHESKQVIMTFEDAYPLTEDWIAKLAPAFDPETTSLIVSVENKQKIEYKIWGAMFFGATFDTRFETPPATYLTRPDVFTVTSTIPGSLIISRRDFQIGQFILGEFTEAIPTPFIEKAMGSYLHTTIENNDGYKEYKNDYWCFYRDTIIRLLDEASTRGHGGIIIIIPNNKVDYYKSKKHGDKNAIDTRNSFQGSLEIESLLKQIIALSCKSQTNDDKNKEIGLKREYIERIAAIAQLACVDGALILSSSLEVISFGSILNAPKCEKNILIGPGGFSRSGEEFEISKRGTRHQSAFGFINECEDCIGFVISEDGSVRGIVKTKENTLLCWPNCRRSMFI